MRIFELNTKKGKILINSDEVSKIEKTNKENINALIHHTSGSVSEVVETVEDLVILFDKPIYSILNSNVVTAKAESFKPFIEEKEED